MVLYEYSRLIESLQKLKQSSKNGILEEMFDPMITVANKYKDLALKCKPILMATMLHPAWQLLLFLNKFQSHHAKAQKFLLAKFKERQALLKPPNPLPNKNSPTPNIIAKDDGYTYYAPNSGQDDDEDELARYHNSKLSLGIKGNVLMWWKASILQHPDHMIHLLKFMY
ncbi:hypothetical protein PCASD_21592 [Puccinia coronata f. sp. avenae]|uniref:HAT C-terminal dimerisation domain-containing protein n=1 Tax=Puccinia coronata f. sp. avenae TaxID=200324 RepID=A0A2N5SWD3_9BASI|nr:hypothetical protein PCASD_21592 [Puccinia coronata f. sp. avenae]